MTPIEGWIVDYLGPLAPLANLSKASTGSWHAVFLTAAVVNFAVVLAALFVLKPIRKRS